LPNYIDIVQRRIYHSKSYSEESIRIFEIILNKLKTTNIIIPKYYWKNKEWFLKNGKKIYFYDLTFPDNKIIIEYNGHMWHPNKNILSEDEWTNWKRLGDKLSADICHKKDIEKKEFAEKSGYLVLEIWSDENLDLQIEKIKQVLYDEFNKNRNVE
jgi:very-short-patch-repair endonuclease